jgi:hypothetical protein
MNTADIPIASPCTADWTTMTLADRGRFCGQCRKVVRELAQMSEREARALLASPPTEGLCVRYVHDASGEILFRPGGVVPIARLSRKVAAAALALALPISASACATTQVPMMGSPPAVGTVAPSVQMGEPPLPPSTDAEDGGTGRDAVRGHDDGPRVVSTSAPASGLRR